MNWQRARQPAQKAERVDSILGAAAALIDERHSLDISMREIADKAGLGKASLYHYFKTKEEVFVSLFMQELRGWVSETTELLSQTTDPSSSSMARLLTSVLRERRRYCLLSAALSTVLEHNLSKDHILSTKRAMLGPMEEFRVAMKQKYPAMSDETYVEFIYQYQAVLAGLWPMAHPFPSVQEVLDGPDVDFPQIEFFQLFEKTIEQLLNPIACPQFADH